MMGNAPTGCLRLRVASAPAYFCHSSNYPLDKGSVCGPRYGVTLSRRAQPEETERSSENANFPVAVLPVRWSLVVRAAGPPPEAMD